MAQRTDEESHQAAAMCTGVFGHCLFLPVVMSCFLRRRADRLLASPFFLSATTAQPSARFTTKRAIGYSEGQKEAESLAEKVRFEAQSAFCRVRPYVYSRWQ